MKQESFYVIGISTRTTNENGQMGGDIQQLWSRFFEETIGEKILNKISTSIYSVYTEYEDDYRKPYTVILGHKVPSLESIPDGMVGITIPEGDFTRFTAKGNPHEGAVFSKWSEIWNTEMNRKYTADFEVYGEKVFANLEDAEVDIFIAVEAE